MESIERALIWLGHIGILSAATTLLFQDEIANPYVGSGILFGGVCSYTLGLAISLYLDKKDASRKANDPENQSIGSVLKPVLFGCLSVVISISLAVILISEYAKSQGAL